MSARQTPSNGAKLLITLGLLAIEYGALFFSARLWGAVSPLLMGMVILIGITAGLGVLFLPMRWQFEEDARELMEDFRKGRL